MTRRSVWFIACTLLICAASAEPPASPPPPTLPLSDQPVSESGAPGSPNEPTESPTEFQAPPISALPPDVQKVRQRFGSPLEGSLLGKPDEADFRAAYERAGESAVGDEDRQPYYTAPPKPGQIPNYVAPPAVSYGSGRYPIDHLPPPRENDLLSISLLLDQQAYELDRRSEPELADAVREVAQQVRIRFRESQSQSGH